MTRYDTALISLDESPEVMAEFPVDYRWNGFLTPHIDALSVVLTLDWLNSDPDYFEDYGIEYDFREDGALVLTERQWRAECAERGEHYEPEVLPANEDGLYPLGAYSWVWSYADWNDDPYHQGD